MESACISAKPYFHRGRPGGSCSSSKQQAAGSMCMCTSACIRLYTYTHKDIYTQQVLKLLAGFRSADLGCLPPPQWISMPAAKQLVTEKAETSRHQGSDKQLEAMLRKNAWAIWLTYRVCPLCLRKVSFENDPESTWWAHWQALGSDDKEVEL